MRNTAISIHHDKYGRKFRIAAVLVAFAFISACSSLPPGHDYPRIESTALAESVPTKLGGQLEKAISEHGGNSGFRFLSFGVDGYLTRMQMINAAEKTLDLQYFIFRGDETGRLLTDAALRAADRGVRVRILTDDGETIAGDEQITPLAAHPSIEVRIYNPFAYRGHSNVIRFSAHGSITGCTTN
jgi:putative cardiolipin synthase